MSYCRQQERGINGVLSSGNQDRTELITNWSNYYCLSFCFKKIHLQLMWKKLQCVAQYIFNTDFKKLKNGCAHTCALSRQSTQPKCVLHRHCSLVAVSRPVFGRPRRLPSGTARRRNRSFGGQAEVSTDHTTIQASLLFQKFFTKIRSNLESNIEVC